MHAAGPLALETLAVSTQQGSKHPCPPSAPPPEGLRVSAYGSKGVLRTVFTGLSTFCPAGLPILASGSRPRRSAVALRASLDSLRLVDCRPPGQKEDHHGYHSYLHRSARFASSRRPPSHPVSPR